MSNELWTLPEYSDWKCYLFGGTKGDGITWRPIKGREPNWFWRLMQFWVFGNRWIREIDATDQNRDK